MYPTAGFSQGFPFVGQQPPTNIYQSQYGGVAGFNSQVAPPFQQSSAPRGQSLPASGRQYPAPVGPYLPPPTSSSRRQQIGQYPPPAPSQQYEYRSNHGSQSRKHHKRRSVSSSVAAAPNLYSDLDQQRKEQQVTTERQQARSQSQSPGLTAHAKQEGVVNVDQQPQQQQQSQVVEGASNEATQGGVVRSGAEQATDESEKRKSGSKKKRHHRRDHFDNYPIPPIVPQAVTHEINTNYPFQQAFIPQSTYFGEYQNELPPQLKVHRQPLYSGYNQAYEESIRRGDVYRKHAKRSTRLPPEVKQQLLPHEDDPQNLPTQQQPSQQPPYQYTVTPGYPQPPPTSAPQPLQPFTGIRPPYNPYQPYAYPQAQPNYYGSGPYNAIQPWSNGGSIGGPAEQEIQRLRSHIHTLEGELHKLQKKLNKATLNNTEIPEGHDGHHRDENARSHRQSKRDDIVSPRQTPIIVELHSAPVETVRESSSKKHRHRTTSATSSQQGQNIVKPDSASIQHSNEQTMVVEGAAAMRPVVGQTVIQHIPDVIDRSRVIGVRIAESEETASLSKVQREDASAAHIQQRSAVVGIPPQPQKHAQQPQHVQQQPQPQPQQQQHQQQHVQQQLQPQQQHVQQQHVQQQHVQQQHQQQQHQQQHIQQQHVQQQHVQQQHQQQHIQQQHVQQQHLQQQPVAPPPPPPVTQAQRPQLHNQQQFIHQQGMLPSQGQQIRGPAPPVPGPGNIRFPGDLHQQQFNNPQIRNVQNPNYNQSNNNELYDNLNDDKEYNKQDEQNRSAERILDAFERFYVNRGKPTTVPMKVKYIPEDENGNNQHSNNHHYHQRNTNNNNRYRSTSRSDSSTSDSDSIYSNSPLSSRRSLYNNNNRKPTTGLFM